MNNYLIAFVLLTVFPSSINKKDCIVCKKWKIMYHSIYEIKLIKTDSLLKLNPNDEALLKGQTQIVNTYDKMKRSYMEFISDSCYIVCDKDTLDRDGWELVPVPSGFKERYFRFNTSDFMLVDSTYRNDSIFNINYLIILKHQKGGHSLPDTFPIRIKNEQMIFFNNRSFGVFESFE